VRDRAAPVRVAAKRAAKKRRPGDGLFPPVPYYPEDKGHTNQYVKPKRPKKPPKTWASQNDREKRQYI
jgi:hypothetical protein